MHIRCPHCHHAVEVLGDSELTDVTCPSCGSAFSLIPATELYTRPDGQRLASGSADQTVKMWDAATGQELLTLRGHSNWIRSVAFSPDGQRLASASDDNTVKVWDAATGQESLTLKGHTGAIWSVVFSPNGQRLASASGDQTVRIWDATPRRVVEHGK